MSGQKSQNDYDHGAESPCRDTDASPEFVEGTLDKVDNKLHASATHECPEVADGIAGSKSKRRRVLSPTIEEQQSVTGTAKRGAERYKIKEANRGTCVIIKNEMFDRKSSPEWGGFGDDVERIENTFRDLRFEIVRLFDLNRDGIRKKISELQKDKNVSKRDCLCIFVLARGSEGDTFHAEDGTYHSSEIWRPFTAEKCLGLAGKPKLLFFQTPKAYDLISGAGDHGDRSDNVCDASHFVPTKPISIEEKERTNNGSVEWAIIPAHADFMIGHSSANVQSWWDSKNKEQVSYVRMLCDVVDEYSESLDVLKMSTVTAQRIRDFQSQYNIMEHLPLTTSTLTKELYFKSATKKSELQGGNTDRYAMSPSMRGKCIVYNHEIYESTIPTTRHGTTADAEKIKTTFEELGFIVEVRSNYTYEEIKQETNAMSKADYAANDCLCIFILTHGSQKDILWASDVQYEFSFIWKNFSADKCPTLKGKPKLFFIQACRGHKEPVPVEFRYSSDTDMSNNPKDAVMNSHISPTHADFLLAHSCVHEFNALRNPVEGSWFVQALCDVLNDYSDSVDLLGMLTITAQRIASKHSLKNNKQKADSLKDYNKQASSTLSTLTKAVYLGNN